MSEASKARDKEALTRQASQCFTTKILAMEALFWGFKGARFTSWDRAAKYTEALLSELVAEGKLEKEQEPLLLEHKPRYWLVSHTTERA
jgi:hypothetical protein